MESLLVQPRLIEYPNDLSGCDFLQVGEKRLLYLCSHIGPRAFIVVLGFYHGQKEDFVIKDLIEPVQDKIEIKDLLSKALTPEYSNAHVFFL
ncbi:MAG: hypothetical protein DA330_11055 [Nitrososphaera sp.]|nr:hypothetical protein [Nitrososphaera sp.]